MKNLLISGVAAAALTALTMTPAFAQTTNSNSSGHTTAHLHGYNIDNQWNKKGTNTMTFTVTPIDSTHMDFNVTVNEHGQKLDFPINGVLDAAHHAYHGVANIIYNGKSQMVQFTTKDDFTRASAMIGDQLQFIDGSTTPSYKADLQEHNKVVKALSIERSHSSMQAMPNSLPGGGGSTDPYSRGSNTGAYDPIATTEVVGDPTLQRSPQVTETYDFRTWLGDYYMDNSNIVWTGANWHVSTGSQYVNASEIFPNPPITYTQTWKFGLSYKNFSLTWSHSVTGTNYSNSGDSFNYTLGLNDLPFSEMIYNGEDNGNGAAVKANLISEYGISTGWHYNGSSTSKLEYYDYDNFSSGWTTSVTASFDYDVT